MGHGHTCDQFLIKCPTDMKPVCGSDGRTYLNKCVMDRFRCHNEVRLGEIANIACIEMSLVEMNGLIEQWHRDHPPVSDLKFALALLTGMLVFFTISGGIVYI